MSINKFSFKEIKAYDNGFRILENGACVNGNGGVVSGSINNRGYRVINLRIKDKTIKIGFHRLQAYCLFGDKIYNNGIEVRHLNGNKLDNSSSNIVIGTHSENMMDRTPENRVHCAEYASSFITKYNKEDVRLFYINNSRSYKKTMLRFGISSKGALHYILNN